MLATCRPLRARLLILVNLSEVHPATSPPPVIPDLAGADPGDHKLDTTGTARFHLSAGPWGALVCGAHSEALTVRGATGGQRNEDRPLIGRVQPGWIAHHFYGGGTHLSVF